jgi:hypothetical protein
VPENWVNMDVHHLAVCEARMPTTIVFISCVLSEGRYPSALHRLRPSSAMRCRGPLFASAVSHFPTCSTDDGSVQIRFNFQLRNAEVKVPFAAYQVQYGPINACATCYLSCLLLITITSTS